MKKKKNNLWQKNIYFLSVDTLTHLGHYKYVIQEFALQGNIVDIFTSFTHNFNVRLCLAKQMLFYI